MHVNKHKIVKNFRWVWRLMWGALAIQKNEGNDESTDSNNDIKKTQKMSIDKKNWIKIIKSYYHMHKLVKHFQWVWWLMRRASCIRFRRSNMANWFHWWWVSYSEALSILFRAIQQWLGLCCTQKDYQYFQKH